jgi:hypothetical protein
MQGSSAATLAALVLALHAAGCGGGSFQVLPVDIPRASPGNRVATTDGDFRVVPEHFKAELELNEHAGRLMVRDDDKKRAIWVAEPFIEQAERDGWSETSFAAENVLEADFGTPQARRVGFEAGTRPPVTIGPHTTLWLRNEDGREAEVPLGAVESLEIDGKQSPGTKAAWIVPVAVGGGLVLGVAIAVMAATFGGMGKMR